MTKKPYLFYVMYEDLQGANRGGWYRDYGVVYADDELEGLASYIGYEAAARTIRISEYVWRDVFTIYCIPLPYHENNQNRFNPLEISTKGGR